MDNIEKNAQNKVQEPDGKIQFGKWLLHNVIWAAILIIALVVGAKVLLGIMTRHGEQISVPDLTAMTVSEAKYNAGINGLKTVVTDSVFIRRMARGAVFSQNPSPGEKVKKGRKIRLTINAVNPKKITMPNLVGLSMRQANAELNSRGLVLGNLIYVSDIATNNVMRQLFRNKEIKPGASIETGAEIDLVVGLNPENDKTYVPNFSGLKYRRAIDVAHESSLNIRKVIFDNDIKSYSDSLSAVVYKQNPSASSQVPVLMGSEVSLWFTTDPLTALSKDSNGK